MRFPHQAPASFESNVEKVWKKWSVEALEANPPAAPASDRGSIVLQSSLHGPEQNQQILSRNNMASVGFHDR